MKVLVIGGSGFVSGTVSRMAAQRGHDVWVATRGKRPLPDGARGITADRTLPAEFDRAIESAGVEWDAAIDCIGFTKQDAVQDIDSVLSRSGHLIFISTDFVYDPGGRTFPQHENA